MKTFNINNTGDIIQIWLKIINWFKYKSSSLHISFGKDFGITYIVLDKIISKHSEEVFLPEINEILIEKTVYNIKTFGDLLEIFGCSKSPFGQSELSFEYLPALSDSQKEHIQKCFPISPKQYLGEKNQYESRLRSGEFQNFSCYLKFYNQLDCLLLVQAFDKCINLFKSCFRVALLDKLRYD